MKTLPLYKLLYVAIFLFAVIAGEGTTYAAPLYTPGQTLTPNCLPSNPDCTVQLYGASDVATAIAGAVGNTVFVSASALGGTAAQNRDALQAILTANAGNTIVLPAGTFLIAPVTDKSKFLTLPAGTILRGPAILKVADSSAPYYSVLSSADCTNCQLSEFTIDANVANNPISLAGYAPGVNPSEILAHPRFEIYITAGSDITIKGITIKNTSSLDVVMVNSASTTIINRVSILDNTFVAIGDDPNHAIHDESVLYIRASGITISRNRFTSTGRGAPGGFTAIETHGDKQIITDNTIVDFTNGMNFCGDYWSTDTEASVISGNSISGALYGIWFYVGGGVIDHPSGYGINGLIVDHNSFRINQLSYTSAMWGNVNSTTGIGFTPGSNLPSNNITISNNVVVFDLENTVRVSDSTNIGIGSVDTGAVMSDFTITGNTVENAPVAGIKVSVASVAGLRITNNIVRNAGTSLDSSLAGGYRVPISVIANAGSILGEVSYNTVLDTLTTSRIMAPFAFSATAAGDLRVLWNNVMISDAVASSWQRYLWSDSTYAKPLFRQIAIPKAWAIPTEAYRAGSQVYDATTDTQYSLRADGTGWTTGLKASAPTGAGITEGIQLGYFNGLGSGVATNYLLSGTTPTGSTSHVLSATGSPLYTYTAMDLWINGIGLVNGIRSTPYGVQMPGRAGPTCGAEYAGILNYTGHTASTKDTVTICAADNTDTWAWRTIY